MSSSPSATPTLLNTLSKSLTSLSSTRKLSVHVLQTEPRKTSSLYAHSIHHPKGTLLQDVLVLLYVHLKPEDLYISPKSNEAAPKEAEETSETAAATPATTSPPSSSLSPVLLVALEAQLYTLPASPSVPSASTILYISKVDTSGYPLPPSLQLPYARTLLTSFLAHHLSLSTRPTPSVWIHLFARAQPQYLFPDSGKEREDLEEKTKPVLGGAGLCRWWKGTMERALEEGGLKGGDEGLGLNVLIPGMTESEAAPFMTTKSTSSYPWKFDLFNLPTPLIPIPPSTTTTLPLSLRLPTFPDDPRSRFLIDLTTNSSTPTPLSSHSTPSSSSALEGFKEAKSIQSHQARQHASDALASLSEEEFYERLAFRQECSLGDTVGFFCVSSISSNTPVRASTTEGDAKVDEAGGGTTNINKTLWSRLHATLLNQSFAKAEWSVKGSLVVWEAVRSMVGEERLGGVEGEVEAVEGAGGVERKRKAVVEQEEVKPVMMLAVRKKKKVVV